MPLKLYPPRTGKTPNWSIRGSYLGVRVDRTAGTPRKAIAEQQRKKLEAEIERGEYPPKPRSEQPKTFMSAAIAYLKDGGSRHYVDKLVAYFGNTLIDEIDQAAIDECADALQGHVKPTSKNGNVYTPVSAILHHAGKEIVVRRPKGYKGKPVTQFLLPPDAFAVVKAASSVDEELGRLLTFLLYTGCRIGEALSLKWENVAIDQRLAYVEFSKNEDPRSIRLKAEALAALGKPQQSGKVFRFHYGGHLKSLLISATLIASGLPKLKRPKRGERRSVPPHRLQWVTFHIFCHTWATWMRRYGGADLQALVATGRWRDPRSASRYTHTAAHEEWDRVDSLPSMGESVESTASELKRKVNQ